MSGPDNVVRPEIELALQRNIPIIPVLVADADMPDRGNLPPSLKDLVFFDAVRFRLQNVEGDTRSLISALESATASLDATSGTVAQGTVAIEPSSYIEVAMRAAKFGLYGLFAISLIVGSLAVLPKIAANIFYIVELAKGPLRVGLQDGGPLSLPFVAAWVVVAGSGAIALYVFRQRGIAALFSWLAKSYYIGLGPGLGFVDRPMNEAMIREALPASYPPGSTISDEQTRLTIDASESAQDHFRRAAQWASYLSKVVRDDSRFRDFCDNEITTIGFVSFGEQTLRLAIIYYLPPLRAFAAVARRKLPHSIEVDGWCFPIVIRPWLPVRHGSARPSGNCWVRCRRDGYSMLTARHAVRPKKVGKSVKISVKRDPRRGRLLRASEKMDAAVIALPIGAWGGKKVAPPSSVIGFKPIRLLSSQGARDGQVIEIPGSTIWAQQGQEPLNGNLLFFNPSLQPGDSGCLVLDREHENTPPYLMYLGKTTLSNGQSYGYGVLLEQVRRIWDLEFYN
ncbi:hypothetical protein ABIB66_006176 [Bradyrhizobium sp. F1.13.3]